MLLGVRIRVGAVWQQTGVIPVHHIIDLVLCEQLLQELWRQIVGDSCTGRPIRLRHLPGQGVACCSQQPTCNDLSDPFYRLHHGFTFGLGHHWGSFAPEDLAVRYETKHQLVAQSRSLCERSIRLKLCGGAHNRVVPPPEQTRFHSAVRESKPCAHLPQGICMSIVHHVKAAIHVYPKWCSTCAKVDSSHYVH